MSNYSEKLKSPKWQKKRLEILQRDNWKCCRCGNSKDELMVHHINYESGLNPWEYEEENLETLCIGCHEDEHNIIDKLHVSNINKNKEKTILTGFDEFDKITGGLRCSNLILLSANEGEGKTSFALKIVANQLEKNIPIAIFSPGMVNINKTDSLHLYKMPLYIDNSPFLSINKIMRISRSLKNKKNIGLIVIDYLELMSSDKRQLTEICRLLKNLAKELNIPILLISELSKNITRVDKRPIVEDLKIEYLRAFSDLIIFLYKKQIDAVNITEVIIARNRGGFVGKCEH